MIFIFMNILQSYFISFKKRLVESSVFQKFWKSVESFERCSKGN